MVGRLIKANPLKNGDAKLEGLTGYTLCQPAADRSYGVAFINLSKKYKREREA
jgi:hypothetical protein